jgi:hypothetical protein
MLHLRTVVIKLAAMCLIFSNANKQSENRYFQYSISCKALVCVNVGAVVYSFVRLAVVWKWLFNNVYNFFHMSWNKPIGYLFNDDMFRAYEPIFRFSAVFTNCITTGKGRIIIYVLFF